MIRYDFFAPSLPDLVQSHKRAIPEELKGLIRTAGVTFHISQHFCSKKKERKTWLLSVKPRWCVRLGRPQAYSGRS